jgi:penicillin-binding protein 1A
VIQRGTATVLRDLDMPLFGKTGTTTGPTNVWFVGGSPDIVAGVYLGYDRPRSLGGWAQGGRVAAPIFKQFVQETRAKWAGRPFLAPAGVHMVRIDRRSGNRVFDGWPEESAQAAVIWEAFKPDTEPRRTRRQGQIDQMRELVLAQLRRGTGANAGSRGAGEGEGEQQTDFVEDSGGIY